MPSVALAAAYRTPPNASTRSFEALGVATVVAATAALGVALLRWSGDAPVDATAFWVFVVGCAVAELAPIRLGRTRFADQVTMSSAFAFAILLGFGALPAMIAYVVSSAIADVKDRTGVMKGAFNAAQYALSIGAAGGALAVLGYHPDMTYLPSEIYPLLVAALVFFAVNHVLAGAGAALLTGRPVPQYVSADLGFHIWTAGFQLAVAPLALVAAGTQLALVVLLAVPLLGIYFGGRHAVLNAHLVYDRDLARSDLQ